MPGPAHIICPYRESLGVSGINPIFRVHGHTILTEEATAKTFDAVRQESLERLFPGFTEESTEQATLSGGQSWIGLQGQLMLLAKPPRAMIAARPKIRDMIRDATIAGLLSKQPFVAHLDDSVETASPAFLEIFDGSEKFSTQL